MTVLTYRGKEYHQQNEVTPKKTVELNYRRNVYTSRQTEARKQVQTTFVYRGVQYQK